MESSRIGDMVENRIMPQRAGDASARRRGAERYNSSNATAAWGVVRAAAVRGRKRLAKGCALRDVYRPMFTQSATPTPPATPRRRRVPPLALLTVLSLLAGFALFAWMAVQTKAPTYDEPLHALGAWLHLHHRDFRVNPEDPPLWHYWAALPNGPGAIRADLTTPDYRELLNDISGEWKVVVDVLYRTEGNDTEAFITRSRAMMLPVGVLLGALVAWWAWEVGSALAMVAAALLFALDPNFLAHAPLVKNDVVFALVVFALAYALWRAGRRLTVWNGLAIGLLCGVGLSVKFSAL